MKQAAFVLLLGLAACTRHSGASTSGTASTDGTGSRPTSVGGADCLTTIQGFHTCIIYPSTDATGTVKTFVAFTQAEAQTHCQQYGGKLYPVASPGADCKQAELGSLAGSGVKCTASDRKAVFHLWPAGADADLAPQQRICTLLGLTIDPG